MSNMTREEQRNIAAEEYTKKWYEDFPEDARISITDFTKGAEWADSHPNWHKVDDGLPPPISDVQPFSDSVIVTVIVTDEVLLCRGYYDYFYKSWEIECDIDSYEVTHWMYLPELPKED